MVHSPQSLCKQTQHFQKGNSGSYSKNKHTTKHDQILGGGTHHEGKAKSAAGTTYGEYNKSDNRVNIKYILLETQEIIIIF